MYTVVITRCGPGVIISGFDFVIVIISRSVDTAVSDDSVGVVNTNSIQICD